MTLPRPDAIASQEQNSVARLAGLLYLLTNAASIWAFSARARLIVRGDAARTARNLVTSEHLFRATLAADLLMLAGVIALLWALYIVLAPVNKNLALLAALWRLVENAVLAGATLQAFAALTLLGGGAYLSAIGPDRLQALACASLRVHGAGFNVGFVFLGLGSALFSYLWLRSRYVPRALPVLGIVASLLLTVVTLATMVFPGLAAVGIAYMLPMGLYEITLGFWLALRGLRLQGR